MVVVFCCCDSLLLSSLSSSLLLLNVKAIKAGCRAKTLFVDTKISISVSLYLTPCT